MSKLDTSMNKLSRPSIKRQSNSISSGPSDRWDKKLSLREAFDSVRASIDDGCTIKNDAPDSVSIPRKLLNVSASEGGTSLDMSLEISSSRLRDQRRLVSRKELRPVAEDVLVVQVFL